VSASSSAAHLAGEVRVSQNSEAVDRRDIERTVRQIVEKFRPEKVILFGSHADGTSTEDSDVDLLVVMATDEKPIQVAARIAANIDHHFPLDIIVRTPSDLRAARERKGVFVTELLSKGIVLYEALRTAEQVRTAARAELATHLASESIMTPLDYSRSFVTFVTRNRGNNARLQIESRCILEDRQAGKTQEYCLFASCKSEHTFAEKDLFHADNYDFCGVFGGDEYVIFRAPKERSERYAERGLWRGPFEDLVWHLREADDAQVLETNQEIVEASLAGHILIGRTELESGDGNLKATLEFPVKTMNANDIRMVHQVDTGPIPFPELDREVERHIDRFELAFVAYNAPDFADFVIQTETPIGDGSAVTYHYSNIRSLPARNCVVRVL